MLQTSTRIALATLLAVVVPAAAYARQASLPAEREAAWKEHQALSRESRFQNLQWRAVGPVKTGARIEAIAIPRGNTGTIYAGVGTGNLWKTVNNGLTWRPVFEHESAFAIGDVAVAPSNPDIVWVGTGEAQPRFAGYAYAGTGVFKSVNGGNTWTHMGLGGTDHIGKVLIHPTNPNIMYVAAMGRQWTRNPERGVFRTRDGGAHWERVLFVDDSTGVIDLVMDPRDANTLYAWAWQIEEGKPLVNSANVAFDNAGHLVFVTADGTIMAAGFARGKLALTGSAVELSEKGAASSAAGWLSVSTSGAMLYGTGAGREAEMAWVTRAGVAQSVDTATHGELDFPALSPDGTRVAFAWGKSIRIRDLVKGTNYKLTNEVGENVSYPAWTSDGRSVSYYNRDSTSYSLHMKRADGGSPASALLSGLPNLVESLWSPDGASVVVRTGAASDGAGDIYTVRASADTTPTAILHSKFTEAEAALSPDGKWLAFISDETGRYEVSVVPYPNVSHGGRWNISTHGGTEPVWSHNGNELFYRDGAGNMVSVGVKTAPTFSFGVSKVLFPATAFATYDGRTQYSVSRDDQRFLMVRLLRGGSSAKLILVKNWLVEFNAKGQAK